jgi:hypothetical protein
MIRVRRRGGAAVATRGLGSSLRRVGLAVVAAIVGVAGFAWWWAGAGDLARDRPWKASSVEPQCNLEGRVCGGHMVDVFFHTREEDSPWIEVDLGEAKNVSSVTIVNRQDCCKERAVPLTVEVSDDGHQFNEVARQTGSFDTWRAQFPRVRARFVRARALRRTMLHFEKMYVR